MNFNKEDIMIAIKECEFMIRKSKGCDQSETEYVIHGNPNVIASIIGCALCEVANIDKTMNKCIYCVCKAIVDEYEEKNGK